jgi:hypothetical protein
MASNFDFLSLKPYTPPSLASHLDPIPSHIVSLAHVSNSLMAKLDFSPLNLFVAFILVP